MEKLSNKQRVFGRELKPLIGRFIESWPELNHITIFYEVNPARLGIQKCTSCNKNQPVIVRYERDHWAQEFYQAFCESCSPPRIIESMRSGKG